MTTADRLVSTYPAENIARDVAGQIVVGHLRLRPPLSDPSARARSLLARRCTEVNRPDLADSLHGVGDSVPGQALVEALLAAYPALLEELEQHARFGPVPTPEAYEKVCAALTVQRARAEAALGLLADLTDPDDCWFDHHGGCQAHGFLSLEPGEQCPHAQAKALLADTTEGKSG